MEPTPFEEGRRYSAVPRDQSLDTDLPVSTLVSCDPFEPRTAAN